jgi:hypothetical protein
MVDHLLGWLVIILPTLFALGIEVVSKEIKEHPGWRIGVIIFGVGLSALTWFQMSRTNKANNVDRENAIVETSKRVSAAVSESVTKAVGEQYKQTIADLHSQIGTLQSQLSEQGKNVNTIKSSNIVTGKKPVKVEVMNPSGGNAPPSNPLPNLSWTQEAGAPVNGKAVVAVQFRVDDFLNTPAFIAVCDRPCKTIGAGITGVSQVTYLSGSPVIAGALFTTPRPFPAGIPASLQLSSEDDQPIKVLTFRILKESEVPTELR